MSQELSEPDRRDGVSPQDADSGVKSTAAPLTPEDASASSADAGAEDTGSADSPPVILPPEEAPPAPVTSEAALVEALASVEAVAEPQDKPQYKPSGLEDHAQALSPEPLPDTAPELAAPDADLPQSDHKDDTESYRPPPSFLRPRGHAVQDDEVQGSAPAWVADGRATEIAAAVLTASLSLAYCLSYGALIFSGPFSSFLGFGVSAALITAIVTGAVVTWRGRFPFAIAGPDSNATAILAAMIGGLSPLAMTLDSEMARLSLLMTALFAATLLTGSLLFVLGWQRAGRLVRYFPYPVMAGFLAATGWLIISGSIRMVSGHVVSWEALPVLFTGLAPYQIGATVGWGVLLLVLPRLIKSSALMPIVLVLGLVLTHVVLAVFGVPLEQAQTEGWLFDVAQSRDIWIPNLGPLFQSSEFPSPWSLLSWENWNAAAFKGIGDVVAVVIVSCLSILMNATGVEMATNRETDLDHELKASGQANIVSAFCGGFIGYMSVSRTLLNYTAGARGRLSGALVALLCLGVLVIGPSIIGVVPRFVLGGLLLSLGAKLLWEWLVCSRQRLPLSDWLVILGLVLLAGHFGFLAALFAGILAGCVIFTLDFSRVSVVRARFGVHEHPSSLMRPPEDMQILADYGNRVQVVVLRSFIFFGSAHRVYEMVKAIIAEHHPHAMVFDFQQVSGVDSSAAALFTKIINALREEDCHICLSGISPRSLGILRTARVVDSRISLYETLDQGLEDLENSLLAHYRDTLSASRAFVDWLSDSLGPIPGDDDSGSVLLAYLERLHLPTGTYLCHAGDYTDAMHFIEAGRLSVLLEVPGKPVVRVRAMARLSVVGEMGFFLQAPRSAGLRAEEECVLWALTSEAYRRLEVDHPQLVQALMGYIIRLQAERLAFANRQILALSR